MSGTYIVIVKFTTNRKAWTTFFLLTAESFIYYLFFKTFLVLAKHKKLQVWRINWKRKKPMSANHDTMRANSYPDVGSDDSGSSPLRSPQSTPSHRPPWCSVQIAWVGWRSWSCTPPRTCRCQTLWTAAPGRCAVKNNNQWWRPPSGLKV